MCAGMRIARLLVALVVVAMPPAAAHADAADLYGPPVAPMRLPAQPVPRQQGQQLAASACYAGPVSCTLALPLRPGQPCHCRAESGWYWGKAR